LGLDTLVMCTWVGYSAKRSGNIWAFHRRAFLHFNSAWSNHATMHGCKHWISASQSRRAATHPNRQDTHCETGDWEQHNRHDRHEHFLRQGDLIDFDSLPQDPASCGFILSDWRFTFKKREPGGVAKRGCCSAGLSWDPQQVRTVRTKVYSTAVPKQLEAGKPWQI